MSTPIRGFFAGSAIERVAGAATAAGLGTLAMLGAARVRVDVFEPSKGNTWKFWPLGPIGFGAQALLAATGVDPAVIAAVAGTTLAIGAGTGLVIGAVVPDAFLDLVRSRPTPG